MFNRATLKSNAKELLRRNYWWIILVTLIFGLVGGTTSSNVEFKYNSNTGRVDFYLGDTNLNDITGSINEYGQEDIFSGNIYSDEYDYDYEYDDSFIDSATAASIVTFAGVFIVVFVFAMVFALALAAFVFEPIYVGCVRWFLKNRTEKPKMKEVVHVFNNGYINTVKTMFVKDLAILGWTLLFIIPGIIRAYEYRMIPYLLAENPEMDRKEAFARSRELMDGNKWDTFVLDLSFIGWNLLSSITLGILGIFYVSPYKVLTDTELYVCLCQGKDNYHI